MTDRLTQLQSCLDQLVTQLFSSINYINVHHDLKVPDEAPSYAVKVSDPQIQSAPPEEFKASLEELSSDIVAKAKQIETLINGLPELGASNTDLLALENELQSARQEQLQAIQERDTHLARCDELVRKLATYKAEMDGQ